MKIQSIEILFAACLLATVGCSSSEQTADGPTIPVRTAVDDTTTYALTPSELRTKLGANERANFRKSGNDIVAAELFDSGIHSIEALKGVPLRYLDLSMTDVSDLSPLAGMPLTELLIEQTPVSDISVLKGMPLEGLKLQDTKVTDLSPIYGMQLKQLNLKGLPISDLAPLADMPLETLWLPGTKVIDLTPIAAVQLVSLYIQDTEIASLEALAGMTTLKRLNLVNSLVEDLTPLKDMKLERLTFTPGRIKSGIEHLRSMSTLTDIRTDIAEQMSSEDFWKRYDLGVYAAPGPDSPDGK